MHEILVYIVIISALIYFINIAHFIFGLTINNKKLQRKLRSSMPSASIIIAVKNGDENLSRMLNSLLKQAYLGKMEFIIVDDNSTDNTKEIILDYIKIDDRIKYINSDQGSAYLYHKKRALDAGIKAAQYEYLLFTDIDCIIQLEWVSSIMSCFVNNVNYVVGHAYVKDNQTILNKFQKTDLLMLLFAAKSMINNGFPWASIGQNQAYTKTLYNNIGGFKKLASFLQGDDTLFLQLAAKGGANIAFSNSPKSYVKSRTEITWKNLLLQRGRWAGDANIMWKFNIPFYIMALALWIMSLGIIILLFMNYFNILFIILLIKLLFEGVLYLSGIKSFSHSVKYIDFIVWFFIHPMFVFIMGLCSFFNFSWKGTSIK